METGFLAWEDTQFPGRLGWNSCFVSFPCFSFSALGISFVFWSPPTVTQWPLALMQWAEDQADSWNLPIQALNTDLLAHLNSRTSVWLSGHLPYHGEEDIVLSSTLAQSGSHFRTELVVPAQSSCCTIKPGHVEIIMSSTERSFGFSDDKPDVPLSPLPTQSIMWLR